MIFTKKVIYPNHPHHGRSSDYFLGISHSDAIKGGIDIEQRICPKCGKPAFSSSFREDWECPNCGGGVNEMANFEVTVNVENLEKVKSIVDQRKAENVRLKLQLGKVLEAISRGHVCPETVDLEIDDDIECGAVDCGACWRKALDQVVVDDDVTMEQLSSPEIAEMHQNGTICNQCGCHIGGPVGDARLCKGCED